MQKYTNVTMQRGFRDAGEIQDLHEDYRQRNLQLPFPNPMPPSPARLASLGSLADASRKMALQNIQYVHIHFHGDFNCYSFRVTFFLRFSGLYEPFPSFETYGQFFLDSALPCASIAADGSPSSTTLCEAETGHLEKVRELVQAAAASLNSPSNAVAPCGPASVLYCLADLNQPGFLTSEHLGNVLIPAMTSVLRLPSLCFVDFSRHSCSSICALVDRMSSTETPLSLLVVDANMLPFSDRFDDVAAENAGNEDASICARRLFTELDALMSCCLKAVARSCRLKVVVVLPNSVSPLLFLKRLPSVETADAAFLTVCNVQTSPLNRCEDINDSVVAASVPLMFSLMNILRSTHNQFPDQQRSKMCWWQLWDAETAIIKAITPPLLTAVSMLDSRTLSSPTRPVSRVAAASRLSTRSSLLSRGSTASIVGKSDALLDKRHALECVFPAIICTFADYADEEDVWRWFQSGGASIMNEVVSQQIDSDKGVPVTKPAPLFVTAARFGNGQTAMVAEDICLELISCLTGQLKGRPPPEVNVNCFMLEDLQLQLLQLILCCECEQRGVILLLPCRSSAILGCIHYSLNPVPSHVIFILLAPLHMAQQVQSWVHPTVHTHLDDAGSAHVPVQVALDAGSRLPACINGHDSQIVHVDAEQDTTEHDAPHIAWIQIYDTRCAIMIHKHFARSSFAKTVFPSKKLQQRLSSPYSPHASPRHGSPPSGKTSPNGDRRSPLSAGLVRKSPADAVSMLSLCCRSLSVACEAFTAQAVVAVVGAVLALPGIPLHLLSHVASSIARHIAREEGEIESNTLPSHRELQSTAVCLAPFFFDTCVTQTELSLTSKFPRLKQNYEVLFGFSRSKWNELQQTASLSLLLIADPASDRTFVGLLGAGSSWLCENLLMMLLSTNCHQTACEIACNLLKWHSVQQRLGSIQTMALMQRCCGLIEYLLVLESPEAFKLHVLRNTLHDLRNMLQVLQMSIHGENASQNVGILETMVLRLWLSAKPDMATVNLVISALHRIAALQDRVLNIFKNSASILKASAPGCVWRLLQRANVAEWLSHVRSAHIQIHTEIVIGMLLFEMRCCCNKSVASPILSSCLTMMFLETIVRRRRKR